ncbi:MAG TPA: lysophospholipid acyltransferase family protein [Gemmatimonadaceae bacterium]|nr:lysophospholipid acyltransferase family protein [Gemmatimonadaceae bacterium]
MSHATDPPGTLSPDTPDPAAAEALAAPSRRRRGAWKLTLGLTIGRAALHLLAHTWRIDVRNAGGWQRLRHDGQPFILSLWHGDMLPLLWVHRAEGVSVLISAHRDGEIVARVAESLGMRTVRGSTSRGGARALLELTRVLRRGDEVAVTPDGPRGPRHALAPGMLVAAQRADAPVVAIGVHASRAWRLRSWDRFLVPKPFARVTVAYSDPLKVAAGNARDTAAEAPRFEALMEQAARAAAEG